jgi:hypothetical protein
MALPHFRPPLVAPRMSVSPAITMNNYYSNTADRRLRTVTRVISREMRAYLVAPSSTQ